MQFRILGVMEVWNGERAIRLSPHMRDLLAVLLCTPNVVVPADRLIEELWGGRPPRTAGKVLQVKIHSLRRRLDGIRRIEHRPPGYVLAVNSGELDALHFKELVEHGRAKVSAGHAAEGAEKFRKALTLWQSAAYVGQEHLPTPRDESARLTEQRLAVVEELMQVELARGCHADIIGDLYRFVAENPFRERLRAQLMLALYQLGRKAEALEVYRTGRRVLVEELGLDVGPELRELEQAILVNDPALDPPATILTRLAP
nr:hypothetical protein GCM10010200_082610 [Actinomadura rugatobispora]